MLRVNHLDLTSTVYVAVRHLFRRLATVAISERLKSNKAQRDWESTRKRAIKSPSTVAIEYTTNRFAPLPTYGMYIVHDLPSGMTWLRALVHLDPAVEKWTDLKLQIG